jgi:hypothetical protein
LPVSLFDKNGERRSDADKSCVGFDPTFLFGTHHEPHRRRFSLYGKVLPAHSVGNVYNDGKGMESLTFVLLFLGIRKVDQLLGDPDSGMAKDRRSMFSWQRVLTTHSMDQRCSFGKEDVYLRGKGDKSAPLERLITDPFCMFVVNGQSVGCGILGTVLDTCIRQY